MPSICGKRIYLSAFDVVAVVGGNQDACKQAERQEIEYIDNVCDSYQPPINGETLVAVNFGRVSGNIYGIGSTLDWWSVSGMEKSPPNRVVVGSYMHLYMFPVVKQFQNDGTCVPFVVGDSRQQFELEALAMLISSQPSRVRCIL